jgi:hypothetical protein
MNLLKGAGFFGSCAVKPWTAVILLLASAGAAPSQSPQAPLPRGGRLEPSRFATIESVPPSPLPDRPPPAENRPRDERSHYAQLAGVSEAEAQERLAEQAAALPAFERLLGTLRASEAGNFTDARMVHEPDWAWVFYFKREPDRTLARYIRHPHFKAALARYSTEELQAIAGPWVERFTRHRLLTGYGTDATYGEVHMDLVVSESEFRAIARREGWHVPDSIRLEFAEGVAGGPVDDRVRGLVRVFPQSDRALGITNQALLGGRIVLRDGCLFVTGPNQADRLAYFGREVALGLDAEGYLALRTREPSPRHLGRIGEPFSWGGPIAASEDLPMVAELRARCGNAPLEHVGVPQSARLFHVRPYVVDAIAERRRISRDEAWRRFRKCLEDREARRSAGYFDCDMI